jgi:hypothetical protein
MPIAVGIPRAHRRGSTSRTKPASMHVDTTAAAIKTTTPGVVRTNRWNHPTAARTCSAPLVMAVTGIVQLSFATGFLR